MVEPTEYLILS